MILSLTLIHFLVSVCSDVADVNSTVYSMIQSLDSTTCRGETWKPISVCTDQTQVSATHQRTLEFLENQLLAGDRYMKRGEMSDPALLKSLESLKKLREELNAAKEEESITLAGLKKRTETELQIYANYFDTNLPMPTEDVPRDINFPLTIKAADAQQNLAKEEERQLGARRDFLTRLSEIETQLNINLVDSSLRKAAAEKAVAETFDGFRKVDWFFRSDSVKDKAWSKHTEARHELEEASKEHKIIAAKWDALQWIKKHFTDDKFETVKKMRRSLESEKGFRQDLVDSIRDYINQIQSAEDEQAYLKLQYKVIEAKQNIERRVKELKNLEQTDFASDYELTLARNKTSRLQSQVTGVESNIVIPVSAVSNGLFAAYKVSKPSNADGLIYEVQTTFYDSKTFEPRGKQSIALVRNDSELQLQTSFAGDGALTVETDLEKIPLAKALDGQHLVTFLDFKKLVSIYEDARNQTSSVVSENMLGKEFDSIGIFEMAQVARESDLYQFMLEAHLDKKDTQSRINGYMPNKSAPNFLRKTFLSRMEATNQEIDRFEKEVFGENFEKVKDRWKKTWIYFNQPETLAAIKESMQFAKNVERISFEDFIEHWPDMTPWKEFKLRSIWDSLGSSKG